MPYPPNSVGANDNRKDTMFLGRVEFQAEDWTPGPNKDGRFLEPVTLDTYASRFTPYHPEEQIFKVVEVYNSPR